MSNRRRLAFLPLILAPNSALSQQDASLGLETIAKQTSPVIRSERSPEFLVARTPNEWAAAWKRPYVDQRRETDGRPIALPNVDFGSSMVVGIILPTKSSGCTGVTIYEAIVSPEQVVVRYREPKPQSMRVCTLSFTTAYHYVKVERSPLPVVFQREE